MHIFLTNSGQHLEMEREPDPFINKPMDLRKRTNRDTANSFVEKMAEINDVFREQMVFAQASYEQCANVHKQNVPNCALGDENVVGYPKHANKTTQQKTI